MKKYLLLVALMSIMMAPNWAKTRGSADPLESPPVEGSEGKEQGEKLKEGEKAPPKKTLEEQLNESLACTPCAYANTSAFEPCPMQLTT